MNITKVETKVKTNTLPLLLTGILLIAQKVYANANMELN